MNKIILNITHRDLDGVVCSILLNDFCRTNNIKFEYIPCSYKNIDNKLSLYYEEKYPIFITDISIVNESLFFDLENRNNIFFIDHHPREIKSLIKNQYHKLDGRSGCRLTFDFIENKYKHKFNKDLKRLMLIADDYDTWVHKYKISKYMNRLFYYYNFNTFFKRFEYGFNGKFNDEEKEFLAKKEKQLNNIKRNLTIEKITDKIGFIVVTREVDEIAEFVMKKENFDYVIMYNHFLKSLSFRGSANSKIHLGKFLKKLGGGGHEKAAAIKIDNEEDIFDIIEKFTNKKLS